MRWLAYPEHNTMAVEAMKFAEINNLPFHEENMEIIDELSLRPIWLETLDKFRESDDEATTTTTRRKARTEALASWKRAVRAVIDDMEAEWNRTQLPSPCILPRRCHPSPYLKHPLANFAFLRLVDVLDPPDQVEAYSGGSGETRPCYLCGQPNGDRFSHLLENCNDKTIAQIKTENKAAQEPAQLDRIINAWAYKQKANMGGLRKLAEREELVKSSEVNPRKVDSTLRFLKRIYNVRKQARYAAGT